MDLQLISLYDYKFNKQFVDACNTAVQTHCKLDTLGVPIKKKLVVRPNYILTISVRYCQYVTGNPPFAGKSHCNEMLQETSY